MVISKSRRCKMDEIYAWIAALIIIAIIIRGIFAILGMIIKK